MPGYPVTHQWNFGTVSEPSRVTVAVTVTQVLAANPDRTYAIIKSAAENSESIWLSLGGNAALNTGMDLNPGGLLQIDQFFMWRGKITAICASGGQYLHVFEAI